jgi:hypothetical protein
MSDQINDGGPVFPTSTTVVERFLPDSGLANKHYAGQTFHGLSKRDYFAAAALTALIAGSCSVDGQLMLSEACAEKGIDPKNPEKLIAKAATDYADALLKELEK